LKKWFQEEIIPPVIDVVNLKAEMMDTLSRVLLQKANNWRILAQRMQQFDVRVRQAHQHDTDAVFL
jgi:hypothetical protein